MFRGLALNLGAVTVEMFTPEITEALKAFERHVVCLEKSPEECQASLHSLIDKALKAYESRGPHLRHGIALDRHLTIIISQSETDRPHCAIYFNLYSPYHKRLAAKPAPSLEQKTESL